MRLTNVREMTEAAREHARREGDSDKVRSC